jgi:hypothetical protein
MAATPTVLTPGNAAVQVTPQRLITSALMEPGILAAGEKLSAQDGAWGLEKLQRLIDQFNARRELIFSVGFNLFTTVANLAPHTIGPGGNFNVPIRPVQIISASFLLNTGSNNPVDTPIRIRDEAWWAANPLKSLTSSIITDLYYDPAPQLGNLNLYPICNVANPVRLEYWNSLPQAVNLQTVLGFVQGYWDAIVLDLAVRLCPSYNRPVPADLQKQRDAAMSAIFANNDKAPRINTESSGMPSARRSGRPDFNFLTGMRE